MPDLTPYLPVTLIAAALTASAAYAAQPLHQPDPTPTEPATTEQLLEHLADLDVLDPGTRVTIRDGRAHADDPDTTLYTTADDDLRDGTYTLVSTPDGHALVLIRADNVPEEHT